MLAFGAYYVLLDVLVSELGWFLPILLVRVAMVAILVAGSAAAVGGVTRPTGVWRLVLLAGLLDFTAFLFYGVGINIEYSAIVAPIGAASPVVTIALAKLLLGERLEVNQKAGVAAVMAAVLLMSL
jgi:drug/metabolite transporter (DMT)-like permease